MRHEAVITAACFLFLLALVVGAAIQLTRYEPPCWRFVHILDGSGDITSGGGWVDRCYNLEDRERENDRN